MKLESKFYNELKRITPQIRWTRLENTSVLGTPDLLGYNTHQHFFTVELKITSDNKIRFSPHQISFHVLHPKNTFILAKKPSQGSFKLFPGTCILSLVKEGFKNQDACCLSLEACGLWLSELGAWGLSLAASGRLQLVACSFSHATGSCIDARSCRSHYHDTTHRGAAGFYWA